MTATTTAPRLLRVLLERRLQADSGYASDWSPFLTFTFQ